MTHDRREDPPERSRTVRESLRAALAEEPLTLRQLSERVGATEKEVADHLAHLARSLERHGERLGSEPPRCLSCGFVFEERSRFARPGKCPSCRSTRIAPARLSIDVSPRA